MAGEQDTNTIEPSAVEAEARALGWAPEDEFRGDKSKWVDAETFVKRGKEQLPLLQADNRRLRSQVQSLTGKVSQLEQLFEGSQEAIGELKRFHEETFNARIKAEKARLRAERVKAREDGDVSAELAAEEALDNLNEEVRDLDTKPKKKDEPTTKPVAKQPEATDSPEFAAWRAANPWFLTDQRKAGMVYGLAQQLRVENPEIVGKAFFELLDEAIAEQLPSIKPKPTPGKVDGGKSGGSGGGSGGGKTFASLPAEAKATAERQVRQFVGANKFFKTEKEWFDHYAKVYYDQEAS